MLVKISEAFTDSTTDDVVRAAEQIVALKAVRACVTEIESLSTTAPGRLAGHLMMAETLLMEIPTVFGEPSTA
ncbi:hypothetical protein JBF12_08625 [Streptomyces javensis]|uniref:Uncharacterized protein n=2 Tax=Streptomyces javensis TaxID=114698 RepID=A0ABS0R6P2_9ACTN|nr:hypothetical protein [Streptomyces javensis]